MNLKESIIAGFIAMTFLTANSAQANCVATVEGKVVYSETIPRYEGCERNTSTAIQSYCAQKAGDVFVQRASVAITYKGRTTSSYTQSCYVDSQLQTTRCTTQLIFIGTASGTLFNPEGSASDRCQALGGTAMGYYTDSKRNRYLSCRICK